MHWSAQKFIEKQIEGRVPFRLSQPGTDCGTGWERLTDDDWRLFGFLQTGNGPKVPWVAVLTDCGVGEKHDLHLLQIGGVLVITNGRLAVSDDWFPAQTNAARGN